MRSGSTVTVERPLVPAKEDQAISGLAISLPNSSCADTSKVCCWPMESETSLAGAMPTVATGPGATATDAVAVAVEPPWEICAVTPSSKVPATVPAVSCPDSSMAPAEADQATLAGDLVAELVPCGRLESLLLTDGERDFAHGELGVRNGAGAYLYGLANRCFARAVLIPRGEPHSVAAGGSVRVDGILLRGYAAVAEVPQPFRRLVLRGVGEVDRERRVARQRGCGKARGWGARAARGQEYGDERKGAGEDGDVSALGPDILGSPECEGVWTGIGHLLAAVSGAVPSDKR